MTGGSARSYDGWDDVQRWSVASVTGLTPMRD